MGSMLRVDDDLVQNQLGFLVELDPLKSVVRQSRLANLTRRENSAEHSWHLAMVGLILAEHAEPSVDASHVMKLLLVHDVVEIDAGDSPIHSSTVDKRALADAEGAAARRIFGLLPPEQGKVLHALWLEFEEARTPAARFAKALDRLKPLLLNLLTSGGAENGITEQQVLERYGPTIETGSPSLWRTARRLVRTHFKDQSAE